ELAAGNPECERTQVWVRLRDGREVSAVEEVGRGHIDKPLLEQELRDKFLECAGVMLPADRARTAWEGWRGLENSADIGELLPLLVSS
ncbi:MAG TPA: hypothetical protein DDZ83_06030, partial [Nitrospinae bacterium]|nr:hypothetical protein [Nitrospinota bacterium]